LQARRVHALLGEKIRALLNCFENRHADNLSWNDVVEQGKRASDQINFRSIYTRSRREDRN
jgi:hypothetical protein